MGLQQKQDSAGERDYKSTKATRLKVECAATEDFRSIGGLFGSSAERMREKYEAWFKPMCRDQPKQCGKERSISFSICNKRYSCRIVVEKQWKWESCPYATVKIWAIVSIYWFSGSTVIKMAWKLRADLLGVPDRQAASAIVWLWSRLQRSGGETRWWSKKSGQVCLFICNCLESLMMGSYAKVAD